MIFLNYLPYTGGSVPFPPMSAIAKYMYVTPELFALAPVVRNFIPEERKSEYSLPSPPAALVKFAYKYSPVGL